MSGILAELRLALPGFTLDAAFHAPARGITAVLGASGAGKSTLLRALAGLERAEGAVRVRGQTWLDSAAGIALPPERRGVGLVFQQAALFPHLSVRGNLEYALKRVPAAERRIGLDAAVASLGLAPLLERRPERLSGGERQRVAIARALLGSPRLLLLDEPVSALDAPARAEVLRHLEALKEGLALPMLYVSHALDEVARLADHAIHLRAGRVDAEGPLNELLARLDSPLALGPEAGVVLCATLAGHEERWGLSRLEFAGGPLWLARLDRPIGSAVRVQLHARDVSLALSRTGDTSILNILPATVLELAGDGPAQVRVRLDCAGTPLLARLTRKSAEALELAPGLAVYAQIKGIAVLA